MSHNNWYIVSSQLKEGLLKDLFPKLDGPEKKAAEPTEPVAAQPASVKAAASATVPAKNGKDRELESFIDFLMDKPAAGGSSKDYEDPELLAALNTVEQPIDVSKPDMPRETISDEGFSKEKEELLSLSGRRSKNANDDEKITQKLLELRELDLDARQRRFVENNLQVFSARGSETISRASQKALGVFRKKGSAGNDDPVKRLHLSLQEAVESSQMLKQLMIRLPFYAGRAEIHRKTMAALVRALQFGSGSGSADLIVKDEDDDKMEICTRFYSGWGNIELSFWGLSASDFENYLSPGEYERLSNGSPDEKATLRERAIIESIASTLGEKIYYTTVMNQQNGLRQDMTMMPAAVIKEGFTRGKLVIDMVTGDASIGIDENGGIVPTVEVQISLAEKDGLPIFGMRAGRLSIICDNGGIAELSKALPGLVEMSEVPYIDKIPLRTVQGSFPDIKELIIRQYGNNITMPYKQADIFDPEESEESDEPTEPVEQGDADDNE